MAEYLKYIFARIDFSNIIVLDAATGTGSTTLILARKMAEVNGKGKIISIDIEPDSFPEVKEKLEDLARYIEFVEADLTNMPQIENESFDLIVCTATMCALNNKPLKALKGLTEFYRVLKKGGELIIAEEHPLLKATKLEEEVQVMRWQFYKSVAELIGEGHYTEIYPEELRYAASLVGFKNIEWRNFEGGSLSKEIMDEWKDVMLPLVNKIKDAKTRKAFQTLIPKIYKKFEVKKSNIPPQYIMKMKKF
jgi:ubiquinone/menaquinone biosynthesis C-methylase UbiE